MSTKILINNLSEENGCLRFTISNCNVSYVNALRRAITSDILCIVIKGYPNENNDVEIYNNTTRLNNEVLKQRLCSIPIYVDDIDNFPYQDYILVIDKENETNEIIYITSEDFKIKNIKTDKFLNQSEVKKIFPANNITTDYIDLVRLRPLISSDKKKEGLKLEAKFSISSCKIDGMYNQAATCSYGNTLDNIRIKDMWQEKFATLKGKYDKQTIENIEQNWHLLDAKRIYLEDSFDFILETVGVFSNFKLIQLATENIIKRLQKVLDNVVSNQDLIYKLDDTMENAYAIKLENEDYTIGKILEINFYNKNFKQTQELDYVSMLKKHPHDEFSIIKLVFKTTITKDDIISLLENNIEIAILNVNQIRENFKQ